MSTIWLITEDESDKRVFEQILSQKGIVVRVEHIPLPRKAGGISRLVKELPSLLRTANARSRKGDCIVVLHDLDVFVPDRQDVQYAAIERICRESGVILLVADDAIEAWMLADGSLCAFLGIRPQNRDGQPRIKDYLESHLRKKGWVYQATQRDRLIGKMDGSGDQFSPSLRQSMKLLRQNHSIPDEPH